MKIRYQTLFTYIITPLLWLCFAVPANAVILDDEPPAPKQAVKPKPAKKRPSPDAKVVRTKKLPSDVEFAQHKARDARDYAQSANRKALETVTQARQAVSLAAGRSGSVNLTSGYGVNTLPDGRRYEGEWRDGHRNGYGVHTWPDGQRYEGEWRDDQTNGYGVHTWPNGHRYEGEWRDNKRNGYGVHTWPDGQRYEGEWRDDQTNGYGVTFHADGSVIAGTWRNDEFVE